MVVVRLEQLQRTNGEAKKYGPPWNHIRMVLTRYNDAITNGLLKKSPPKSGNQLWSMKDSVLELCGDKWSWWTDTMKVKAIQKYKWSLTQKRFMSLLSLANYNCHFIQGFLKVARTFSALLKKIILRVGWTFGELKNKYSLPHVLRFLDFYKPFEVHTTGMTQLCERRAKSGECRGEIKFRKVFK